MTIFKKLFSFLKHENFWENLFMKHNWYCSTYVEIIYFFKTMLFLLNEKFMKHKWSSDTRRDKMVFFQRSEYLFLFS